MGSRIVAVVSGGPDSTCSLIYWLSKGYDASVLFFDYGHKASKRELESLQRILSKLNNIASTKGWGKVVELVTLNMEFMKNLWRGTQLTDSSVRVLEEYDRTVVVPLRNAVMATIAAAYAYTLISTGSYDKVYVVLGSQYDDVKPREDTWEPRYPDCSPECFSALELAFKVCHFRSERKVEIWTPSIAGLGKSELLKMCYDLVGDLVYETWSCYQGFEKHCGVCESCRNRKKAFAEAGLPDKTEYMA